MTAYCAIMGLSVFALGWFMGRMGRDDNSFEAGFREGKRVSNDPSYQLYDDTYNPIGRQS